MERIKPDLTEYLKISRDNLNNRTMMETLMSNFT